MKDLIWRSSSFKHTLDGEDFETEVQNLFFSDFMKKQFRDLAKQA